MATKAEMCEFFEKFHPSRHEEPYDDKPFKRQRVECPSCGRRMMGWMIIHDGEVLKYAVPPHKRKGWWKKAKKKVEKRMAPRGK